MSRMLKSSGAMGLATLATRFLGLAREMAYAQFMGGGWVADAFMFAFTIPNLFRRLLGEGALTAAFIPIFKEKEKQAGEAETWRAANAVLSGLILSATALVVLGIGVISLLLQGEIVEGKTLLMLQLLRLMFPYLLLVCVAALFMGMLNARGRFFVPALGPAILNLCLIASVLIWAPRMGHTLDTQIYGVALGVLLAGVAQAFFQLPALRGEGYRFAWVPPWRDDTVRRVVKQMVPGTLGVAAFHINVMLTQGFGFMVGDGVVATFNYAVRLMELPQGIFGISLATYLLPTLSGLAAEKNFEEFRVTLRQGLGYLGLTNLLAAVLLLTLAEPMVRLLFERGRFDPTYTRWSAQTLVSLAPGLVAFSMVNILARAFYALGDTNTPMQISVFCLALNIAVAGALVWPLKHVGLGLANTLTAMLNVALLSFALRRKLGRLDWRGLRMHFSVMGCAALIAGGLAWGLATLWGQRIGHATFAQRLGEVFVPIGVATAAYGGLLWWFNVPFVQDLLELLPTRKRPTAQV
jgi:putative peptidoglycan lipid II flippase